MKILLVTQWFEPEPTLKGLTFAKALAHRGHEVSVLTGFPNYPGGRIYESYRIKMRQREVIDGIPVVRVPLYPSHDRSAVGRVANYASFAAAAAVIGLPPVGRPDVAYVYHPPATVALPALLLKRLRGVPFVLDVQDLWPDTLAATGMMRSPTILNAVDAWCRLVYRSASAVTVLSPGYARRLVDRGVPAEKVHVIPNWAPGAAAVGHPVRTESGERFNVLFAGTMGPAQALESVLDAAQLVAARRSDVQFTFVGGGIDVGRLTARAAAMQLPNVRFLPPRSSAEVAPLLASADLLLVHLRDDPLFAVTIPSKTQAYMSAGRPILMAVRGDAAALVQEAGCGWCVPPEDPAALATAICQAAALDPGRLDAMGTSGRIYYQRHLSLDTGVAKFEALFGRVAGVPL